MAGRDLEKDVGCHLNRYTHGVVITGVDCTSISTNILIQVVHMLNSIVCLIIAITVVAPNSL